MICPYCDQEIKYDDLKFLCGIDKPYLNVWFHRSCYKSIDNLFEYVSNNIIKLIKTSNAKKIIIRKKPCIMV
jgi:hypothetical protein